MSASTPKLDDLRINRPSASPTASRTGVFAGIAVLVVVAALAVWWLARPRALAVETAIAREVAAGPGGERTVLNASGYVTARREATVSSKVTGKVVDVLIEEGVRVEAGQVLAHLDDANVKSSLALAEAQLDSARSGLAETRVRVTEAERDFARQAALLTGRVASQADYDRAESALQALRARLALQQAEVTVAERNVALWRQQLDDTVIRAPFAGIVTSKNAQPGEMISPMSSGGFTRTGICTVVDMESLEIEIDVNESYINRVAPGQPVEATLDAYPDWKIPCKVIAIIPTADRQKSTVRVRVGFDRLDPRILPQMAVKVAFQEKAGQAATAPAGRAVAVPRRAVLDRDGRNLVFVARDGRVERRAVTLSGPPDGDAVLSAGVSPGERVVLDPPANLTDGAAVEERKP
ncbi:MAG: efflux RND transporter periplasmic adaptor subunit [Verrucomicrobiota bacterium]